MTELQLAVKKLRKLCNDSRIYNFAALEAFIHMGDGVSQDKIAEASGQKQSSIGDWISLMECWGFVEKNGSGKGRLKTITYTADGESLILQLEKILTPSPVAT